MSQDPQDPQDPKAVEEALDTAKVCADRPRGVCDENLALRQRAEQAEARVKELESSGCELIALQTELRLRAEAEVKRLKDEAAACCKGPGSRLAELEADNERMREKLVEAKKLLGWCRDVSVVIQAGESDRLNDHEREEIDKFLSSSPSPASRGKEGA